MPNGDERFTVTEIAAIEEIPVVGGTLRWKPIRRTLGIGAFGANAYVADAGQVVVEPHDELGPGGAGGHQELYVVLAGRARFTIDGSEHEAGPGGLVFLRDPAVHRQAVALEDGTMVLAVGAPEGEPFRPSAWEHYFAAEADVARGDHRAAAETVRAGLAEHADNASLHFNLACHLAKAGEDDEALAHLRRALQLDPERLREHADTDEDLAALRARPDWPA